MRKYCQKCQKYVEYKLVVCPDCKGELTNQNSTSVNLSVEQINEIVKLAVKKSTKKIGLRLWGGFSIVAVGSFVFTWWNLEAIHIKSVAYLEKLLNERIETEFKTEKIKQTVINVAENKSNEIVKNILEPSIKESKSIIDRRTIQFEDNLNRFTEKYDSETNILSKEIEYLKKRNDIFKLRDEIIATGRSEIYDKLVNILNNSDTVQDKALPIALIKEVKGHFATMTGLGDSGISFTDPSTQEEVKNEKVPTEVIINDFQSSVNWKNRANAVKLLKNRKELGVPELLLQAMHDEHLEVRKLAVDSFEIVTGYNAIDVFDDNGERSSQWWAENKERVEKKFQKLQSVEDARKKRAEDKTASKKE